MVKLWLAIVMIGLCLGGCKPANRAISNTEIPTFEKTATSNLSTLSPKLISPTPSPSATDPIAIPEATVAKVEETPAPANTVIADPIADLIADHTRIAGFANIPAASLQAAEGIKTLFMHQSTGNNIDFMGLQCLEGLHNDVNFPPECVTLAQDPAYSHYDSRNWTWQEWATPMADAIAKTDMWVGVATAQQANYQVLGMKFCYIDGWNIDFSYYKTKMEQLEQAYPGKTFIWSTSAIWAESTVSTNLSAAQQTQTFNQQVRAYALANHKVLYDIADIESHDPSGNACQSNGVEVLCDVYYTGWGGGGGGHSNGPASLRLAEGFWWLMARISGWDG